MAPTGCPPPRIVAFQPAATSGTLRLSDCGGSLKLCTDRSTVVVSPARTVSAGYLVVRNRPVMPGGAPGAGSAAFAAAAESTNSNVTASSRRTMLGTLPTCSLMLAATAPASRAAARGRQWQRRADINQRPAKPKLSFFNVTAQNTLLTIWPNQPWPLPGAAPPAISA